MSSSTPSLFSDFPGPGECRSATVLRSHIYLSPRAYFGVHQILKMCLLPTMQLAWDHHLLSRTENDSSHHVLCPSKRVPVKQRAVQQAPRNALAAALSDKRLLEHPSKRSTAT